MEQKKNFKRTTVTSALPYANGGVHIGHLAGVYVPADIYVRYLRLKRRSGVHRRLGRAWCTGDNARKKRGHYTARCG